jgi:hypothetical protein
VGQYPQVSRHTGPPSRSHGPEAPAPGPP